MRDIALDRQVKLYSVDTSYFYTEEEKKIHNELNSRYYYKSELGKKQRRSTRNINRLKKENFNEEYIEQMQEKVINRCDKKITLINKDLKRVKNNLLNELNKNNNIRTLNQDMLKNKDIITLFDSALTRTIGIPIDTLTKDLIIVKAYYFKVLEDIIKHGFIYDGQKYVVFTASAGQIRTKRTIFIRESVLNRIYNSLSCGLSVDDINNQGGVNINKYLAYLALCNSATDIWKDFDITKSIVVNDIETNVGGLVDFIDRETYQIERKYMDTPIEHTDGCGIILPKFGKKAKMIRLPWVKGLLVPFPFDKFIREWNRDNPENKCGKVKDIYGIEHDILKEGIEVIFTKSQFKMWKYYNSWEQYQDNYIKYRCQAGQCNEEKDIIDNARLNYQMLQTLTDIKDIELEHLAQKTKQDIINMGADRKIMLKVLGVTKSNTNKNYLQQALEIYPELLADTYSQKVVKQTRKSLITKARSAKLDINGKYTFIIPDLYAFCERLFLGIEKPKGLLQDGEVSCKLYSNGQELDCLRSPHLYREHAVRKNVISKEISRWFVTKGLYISSHDLISKILQCDFDGDTSLVCSEKTLVEVAKRNMRDIVPLYYVMEKAKEEQINPENIYKGLTNAYKGGNIGIISNDITKIWNNPNPNLDVVKWLTMENNFVIDYAKTLYKTQRPPEINKLIRSYTKHKVPKFFMYAKDKKGIQVEKANKSTVNRLNKIIPSYKLNINASNIGKFDYKMLMNNSDIEVDGNSTIVRKYKELDVHCIYMIDNNRPVDLDKVKNKYKEIRKQILEINSDVSLVTDTLVKYLYCNKPESSKVTLWECFGDVIVKNLKQNIKQPLDDGWIMCEVCGKRIEKTINNKKYCDECAKLAELEKYKRYNKKRK